MCGELSKTEREGIEVEGTVPRRIEHEQSK